MVAISDGAFPSAWFKMVVRFGKKEHVAFAVVEAVILSAVDAL